MRCCDVGERAPASRARLSPTTLVDVAADTGSTAVARTVTDVARERGVRPGLIAADHALHAGRAIAPRPADALQQCARWPGRTAARRGGRDWPMSGRVAAGVAEPAGNSRARLPDPSSSRHLRPARPSSVGRPLLGPSTAWSASATGNLKYDGGRGVAADGRAAPARPTSRRTGSIVVRWGGATSSTSIGRGRLPRRSNAVQSARLPSAPLGRVASPCTRSRRQSRLRSSRTGDAERGASQRRPQAGVGGCAASRGRAAQRHLADAHRRRRDLDALVLAAELQRLLQRQRRCGISRTSSSPVEDCARC